MAWQRDMALTDQIAAKATTRHTGRNLTLKAIRQPFVLDHALTGILGILAPLFKRRITSIGLCRVFPKVG
jgi:hypothetical protein